MSFPSEIDRGKGALALDLATGTGAVALPLARSGARVLALDVASSMLAQFPRAAAALPIARVLGSAQSLPLPAASVDVITCGFGIAFFPDDATDVPGLIAAADSAMYAAKRAGKNRVAFHATSAESG